MRSKKLLSEANFPQIIRNRARGQKIWCRKAARQITSRTELIQLVDQVISSRFLLVNDHSGTYRRISIFSVQILEIPIHRNQSALEGKKNRNQRIERISFLLLG